MNNIDWKKIKHFQKSEFKYPEKMVYAHIKRLDRMRENTKMSTMITSDWRDSETSEHGKGTATDIIFPRLKIEKLYYMYLEAERHGFTGIGIYPQWELDGKIVGGLHVDSRSCSDGRGARWICIKDENGKQIYLPFTWENMIRYVIV